MRARRRKVNDSLAAAAHQLLSSCSRSAAATALQLQLLSNSSGSPAARQLQRLFSCSGSPTAAALQLQLLSSSSYSAWRRKNLTCHFSFHFFLLINSRRWCVGLHSMWRKHMHTHTHTHTYTRTHTHTHIHTHTHTQKYTQKYIHTHRHDCHAMPACRTLADKCEWFLKEPLIAFMACGQQRLACALLSSGRAGSIECLNAISSIANTFLTRVLGYSTSSVIYFLTAAPSY